MAFETSDSFDFEIGKWMDFFVVPVSDVSESESSLLSSDKLLLVSEDLVITLGDGIEEISLQCICAGFS